jgi:hypothetical protein
MRPVTCDLNAQRYIGTGMTGPPVATPPRFPNRLAAYLHHVRENTDMVFGFSGYTLDSRTAILGKETVDDH